MSWGLSGGGKIHTKLIFPRIIKVSLNIINEKFSKAETPQLRTISIKAQTPFEPTKNASSSSSSGFGKILASRVFSCLNNTKKNVLISENKNKI